MADPALLAEAYKRGLLPPDQAAAFQEAQRRGLVPGGDQPPASKQDVVGDALSGAAAPFVKLGRDVAAAHKAKTRATVPGSLGQTITDELKSLGGTVGILGDVLGLTSAPVQAVTRPIAGAISRLPMQAYSKPSLSMQGGLHIEGARPLNQPDAQAALEGDLNTALSAARPAGLPAPIQGPVRPMVTRQTPAPPMSLDQLQAAKTAAYKAVENAGVQYAPQAVDGMIADIDKSLTAANISPSRHPKASSMMDDIRGLAGQPQSLTQLDQLRQVVRRDVANPRADDAERLFGGKMIAGIDHFIENATPGDVIAGNPQDAAAAITTARDLNSRFRKVEAVTDAVDSAKLRAGSTGSGGNVDNATRQTLRSLLEHSHNLTDDEVAALTSAVMGDGVQNAMRLVGKLSPSGNGLMAALNLGGAAMGGPLGAVPGAIGLVSKLAADATTGRKVSQLLDLMAVGGQRTALPRAGLPQIAKPSPRASVGAGVIASPVVRLPIDRARRGPAKAER